MKKTPFKHSLKFPANVIEEIVASVQVLQYVVYMDPVYPANSVYVSCFPHSLHYLYLPSPASEASCRLHQLPERSCKEYWWGVLTVLRCVSPCDGLPLPVGSQLQEDGRGLRRLRNSLFEWPWPTPFNLHVSAIRWGEPCQHTCPSWRDREVSVLFPVGCAHPICYRCLF